VKHIHDKASDLAEQRRQESIEAHRNRAESGPKATGYCLNCEAPVEKPRRWCDVECRDDWERYT